MHIGVFFHIIAPFKSGVTLFQANRSNVRECFFQAVSNSSWANFGYLVAAEIEGQDTL
jgi:hypothetical protein